jgi:hypothetical protein
MTASGTCCFRSNMEYGEFFVGKNVITIHLKKSCPRFNFFWRKRESLHFSFVCEPLRFYRTKGAWWAWCLSFSLFVSCLWSFMNLWGPIGPKGRVNWVFVPDSDVCGLSVRVNGLMGPATIASPVSVSHFGLAQTWFVNRAQVSVKLTWRWKVDVEEAGKHFGLLPSS